MSADVRYVLGLTAEGWAVAAFLLVVISICCQELGRFFASLSVVRASRIVVPERRSSIPPFRAEAIRAKRGVWR